MATTCFGSIKAKVVRVTRLNDCGVPVIGMKSTVVSGGFIKVDISPEYEDGEEFVQKNAWGDFCINEEDKPRLKRVGVAIDFCQVDPDLFEIVTGARLIMASTNAVGMAFNEDAPDGRFSLESWSKVPGAGGCSGGAESYVYWLLGNIGNGKIGDMTLENGAVTFSLSGTTKGVPGTIWTAGATPATTGTPYAASYLPASAALLAGDHFATNVTTIAPPVAACGAIELEDAA